MDQQLARLAGAAAVALAGALGTLAASAQTYPSKPVTLVSPYGAGGNADLAARSLAAVAQKYLGQPIVVVDRTGAGGIVGSQFVLNSPNDGYTLLLARVGSQAVGPALDPATPYKWDSFTIIGMLEMDPYVCVVAAKSPHKSFADLLSAIKKNPGKLTYASTGNADASVVFPVQAFLESGLPATAAVKVPYRGAGETASAVLGGVVDFACNGISPYIGGIKGGELRPLVVSTSTRVPEAPTAPTAAEVGIPKLELVTGWSALYGPATLSNEALDKWFSVLEKVKADTEWTNQVRKRGVLPSIMSQGETTKFVEAQYNTYRALAPYFKTK